jgi:hypothetical protein
MPSRLLSTERERDELKKSLSDIQSANTGLKIELSRCKIDLKNSLKREKKQSTAQTKTSSDSDSRQPHEYLFSKSPIFGFGHAPTQSDSSNGEIDKNIELKKRIDIQTSHIAQLTEKLKYYTALVAKYKLLLQDFRDNGNGNKYSSVSWEDNNIDEHAVKESIQEIEVLLDVLRGV